MSASWYVCVDKGSEVKELTPEWYSNLDFARPQQLASTRGLGHAQGRHRSAMAERRCRREA